MLDEDEILTKVAAEQYLAKLSPRDRVMLEMINRVDYPDDYDGPWPATYSDIGRYVGLKFHGEVLSEAAIRYRRDVVYAQLRGERGPLRAGGAENPGKSPKLARKPSPTRRNS